MHRRISGLQPPTTRQLVMLANVAVVACCCVFVWLHLQPHLLLRNTTPSGGDMGAHVWGPAYLRDTLLADGRLTGWTMDWYAGFPALTFYFPLPSLMIALLSFLVPYGIAFKLVTVAGLVSLPVAAAAFGALSGMKRPYPACLAVATVPFLFDQGWTIYGGNVGSTLAGEFSFSISLSLALVFLGVLARSLDTGRHRGWAIVLFGATILCHILPAIFAIVAAVVMVLIFPRVKRFVLAATVGVLGLALTGFWLVPFAVRLPFTNDMGWEKIERYGLPLFGRSLGGPEEALLWLSIPAAVGIAIYGAVAVRSRWYVAAGAGLGVAAVLGGMKVSAPIVRAFDKAGTPTDVEALGQANLDPLVLRWLLYAAVAGAVVSLLRGRRLGTILTYTAVMAAIAFRFMPGPTAADPNAAGKLWNARMLPFWYLCLYLLAACLVAEVALVVMALSRRYLRVPDLATRLDADEHARQARMLACLGAATGVGGGTSLHLVADSLERRAEDMHERAAGHRAVPEILVPTVAAFIVLGWVAHPFGHSWLDQPRLGLDLETSSTYVESWAKWNYVGYEGTGDGPERTGEKPRKVEYFDVVNMMKRLGQDRGCGRAMWEYEEELNAMGTPMALMLLPYWTDSCIGSSEGLYFESSPT
ncbi:MAG: 6-pyruvoyl-tetrahydropterin synthase-related protein, partial [Acidimicrobiales bacterium]